MRRKHLWNRGIGLSALLSASLLLGACGATNNGDALQETRESEAVNQTETVTAEQGKEEEPYTIVYAFDVWVQQQDWDIVEENVSNLVEEKIGAKVKLLPMTGANYTQQINLMISSGEKLDLYNASARTTFNTDVASNKIMGLDRDLVEQYAPGALEEIGDFIKATTIDGKIYGFPTLRDMADAYGLIIRDDLAEKYGVDVNKTMTIEEVDELFAKIKEGEPDMYVTQPQGQTTSVLDSIFRTYDNMADNMGVLMDQGQGELKLVNLFETDYYKECVEKAREWNNKGYILPDASTNPDTGVAYYKTGKVATTLSLVHPGVATDETNMTGIKSSTITVYPAFTNTQQVGAIIQSIPTTCENPGKVLEFIDLLYTDAEVYNALVWGIEGKHYVHVEGSDRWITYPEGVTADTSGYTLSATYNFGNRYLSYIWDTDPEDLNERFVRLCLFVQQA